ncbi:hypothetical protein EYF80_030723 [Liparis tanakae]|uniref:Uncharacterized protein n=1 Tax=Liparis tanakae TaxID=230148 RepID=A0A4Z2H012_9TELE|nr:hypothetical protein EYF80_030723 [Liparis tanakae]
MQTGGPRPPPPPPRSRDHHGYRGADGSQPLHPTAGGQLPEPRASSLSQAHSMHIRPGGSEADVREVVDE